MTLDNLYDLATKEKIKIYDCDIDNANRCIYRFR